MYLLELNFIYSSIKQKQNHINMVFISSNKNTKNYKTLISFRKLIAGLVVVICLNPNLVKGQGYYNQESFGNRSILLSGNVTGSVDDLGMLYYNPARLALVNEPNFTINAKAFQLKSLNIQNVFGRNNKLSESNFEGLPSMVAGTFKVGKSEKHKFAYAILSRNNSDTNLGFSREIDTEILEDFDNVDRLVAELNLTNSESDEWFGASWATNLKENFSVGVSTFVSIYSFNGSYDLNYSRLDPETNVAVYDNKINFGQDSYGIFMKIGLAWKLPKANLGLNIDLPYIEVLGSGNMEFKEVLAGIGDGNDVFEYAVWDDLESKRKEPIGVSFGVGLPLGKHTLHLKTDWHGKVNEYKRLEIPVINDSGEIVSFSFKEELRSVINFGLGAEFYIGEKFNIYVSGITDFSPTVSNANIFDLIAQESKDTNFDADFYHFGLGVQLKLSWAQLVIGSTYSRASVDFERPVDFPDPEVDLPNNDELAKVTQERWRFIIGLEIPIFGHKIEFN